MGQDDPGRSGKFAANRRHAATVWDSFDSYLRTFVDPIEPLAPDDDSSDGKALIHRVRAGMTRRGSRSNLGESDKIEMVCLNEIMAALKEEGNLLPLRQTFDFYTLSKAQREEILSSVKGKSHLSMMWDPETPWEEKHEAKRMSLTAWGRFCGQCGLDDKLNTSLGSCIAAMLERPKTSMDAVHGFLEGQSGFDPETISVSLQGFLASVQGVIMRHILAKQSVRGEIARIDSKTMLKGIIEVLHQAFDKSPINRFLKLKNSITTRSNKQSMPLRGKKAGKR